MEAEGVAVAAAAAALGLASSRTSGAVPPKEEELRAAVEVLRGHGLHSVLEEWFVEVLQNDLQGNIATEFWNAIALRENSVDEPQCLGLLLDEKRPVEEQPPFGVYAVILSSEFWPPFKDEKLEVPEDIRAALDVYCKKYEKLKAMRTLSWKHTLGLVTMDVELADRTLSVAVTPVQAVVLLYFQNQASWTLEELSKVVKMPVALLRRRMSVWLQQGVLREEPPGTFSVIEEERPQDRDNMVLIDSDDESDSGMASQADQKEEELLLFWAYIQAMLTNLESLSLERIYSMLRMFVMTGPALAEIDLQELQGYLQKKVRDQQLIYSAGVYRLPKNSN